MPRPCKVCSLPPALKKEVDAMIMAGATDPAVAAHIGNGIHRTAVQRHRAVHVIAPARELLAVAGRGQDLREERAEIAAATAAGDPTAFLALHSIVNDLKTVYARLDASAAEAAQDRQPVAVAGLSAQQLRATEVRGKLGNHGAFAPSRGRDAELQPLNLVINFTDRQQRIVAEPMTGPLIDTGQSLAFSTHIPALPDVGDANEEPEDDPDDYL